MKPHLLLGYFLFTVFLCKGQSLEWVRTIGGTGTELSMSPIVDAAGNIYTSGHFEGAVDFDPGPADYTLVASGGWDIYVAKHNANGDLLWAKRMGGSSIDGESGIVGEVDNAGNIYVTGTFTNAGDFGGINLTSNGWRDAFICKLDNNGNMLWAKNIGGVGVDAGYGLKQDAAGYIYVTGIFEGTIDFDPGPGVYNLAGPGNQDFFILKLDSNGNFIWAKVVGGPKEDSGISLAIDQSGFVYIAGTFQDTVDFDPGPGVFDLHASPMALYYAMFILKLNSNGNFVWAKTPEGTQDVFCNSIYLDSQANVYTYGHFEGTIDVDPGPGLYNYTSLGFWGYDSFILKLDSTGNFGWSRRLEGVGSEYAFDIALDADDNIYIAGDCDDTLYLDPGFNMDTLFVYNLVQGGFVDVLSNMGSFLGYAQIAGSAWSYASGVAADAGYFYVTGSFNDTVSFHSQLSDTIVSNGGSDMFLAKYQLNPVGMKKNVQAVCSVFPNPSTGRIEIRAGKMTGELQLEVINAIGNIVAHEAMDAMSCSSVEISGPPGLYWIKIIDGRGLKTVVKVVKQ